MGGTRLIGFRPSSTPVRGWNWLYLLSLCSLVFISHEPRGIIASTTVGRDRLIQLGIDERLLHLDRQEKPWEPRDAELALRLFPRLPRMLSPDTPAHPMRNGDWSAVLQEPQTHLGTWLEIQGHVETVQAVPLDPDARRRAELDRYYLVTLATPDPVSRVMIGVAEIPEAWQRASPVGQPTSARGLFLRLGPPVDGKPHPFMIAARIAWRPTRESIPLGVTHSQTRLAAAGFDVGLLDVARRENRTPLTGNDHEPFFRLFAAADKSRFKAQPTETLPPLSISKLLQAPERSQGEFLRFQGVARRIVRILVDDPVVVAELGQEHYFQVDVLVPLDRQVIQMGNADSRGEGRARFEGTFPITVCAARLPDGLVEGENVRQNVQGVAVFYKLWSFPSELMAHQGRGQRQVGPLLVGGTLQPISGTTVDTGFGVGLASLILVSLVGLAWGVARQPHRRTMAETGMSRESSNEIGAAEKPALPDRPDFSNLP